MQGEMDYLLYYSMPAASAYDTLLQLSEKNYAANSIEKPSWIHLERKLLIKKGRSFRQSSCVASLARPGENPDLFVSINSA